MIPDRNIEAEQSVIGSILIEPRCISKIIHKLTPDDFQSELCAVVYEAAVDAYERGKNYDHICAVDTIRKRYTASDDAANAILEIVNLTPTAANVVSYAKIVRDISGARRLNESVREITTSATDPQSIAADLISTCQSFLSGERSGRLKSINDALTEFYDQKPENTLRIDTGFPKLDSILKGITGGNLVLVGARPGVGKSAYILDVVRTAAKQGNKCLIYSMEMLAVELAERLVARDPRVTLDQIIDRKLTDDDWKAVAEITGKLSKLPIIISDEPHVTVNKIRTQAMSIPDLKMIVVDFLTLMQPSKKYESQNLAVGAMSRELKNLAMEMKIPVVALAQLNREKTEFQKPELSDLRDSGELEQNANKVIFLWNLDEPIDGVPTRVGCSVAKNRRGNRGTVVLKFDGSHMRFIETDEKYEPPKQRGRVFKEDK